VKIKLKMHQNSFAAGLRPDTLRELKRSPVDHLAAIWGLLLRGVGVREGRRERRGGREL